MHYENNVFVTKTYTDGVFMTQSHEHLTFVWHFKEKWMDGLCNSIWIDRNEGGKRGEELVRPYSFIASALHGVDGQRHAPADLLPRKRARVICMKGWQDLKDDLDGYGKEKISFSHRKFELRTLQQATSHCMDNGFLVPANMFVEIG
jgi:hypothetical protein